MRIIAGKYRGRKLKGPGPRNTFTRPMLDRVRETLFNILSHQVENTRVLDLCSGTGSIGLEALSRGAATVDFVEQSKINVNTIRHNIKTLQVEDQTRIVTGTLPHILKACYGTYNLVLFDPPFPIELSDTVLPALKERKLLSDDAIVVVERSKLHKDLNFEFLELERKKQIGDSVLWIFRLAKTQTN